MANDFSSDSSVKALWRFESGALTVDSKGANTLTNHGGTEVTSGPLEGACSIQLASASSQYLSIADASLAAGFPLKSGDTTKQISLCMRYKPNSLASSDHGLWGKWGSNLCFLADVINGALNIGWATSNSGVDWGWGGIYSFTISHVYHITFVMDGVAKTIKIVIYDITAGTQVVLSHTYSSALNVSDADFTIGAAAGGGAYIDGIIDEVVVFNRLIAFNEITAIQNQTFAGPYISPSPGNIFTGDSRFQAVWDFEAGALATDSSPAVGGDGANTLTSQGSPNPVADPFGVEQGADAAYFNESAFGITNANLSANFPLKSTDTVKKITICGWVIVDPTRGYQMGLWSKCSGATGTDTGIGAYFETNYHLMVVVNATIYDTGFVINPWAMYHITFVIDGLNNTLHVRVFNYSTGGVANYDTTIITVPVDTGPFYLGADALHNAWWWFQGWLDEFVVANALLSDAEIDAIRGGTYASASTRNLTTAIAAASAASAPIAAITRPLTSSLAAVSVVSAPILAITRGLQATVAAGSVTSDILLLNTLITAIAAQSQVSSPSLDVGGSLNTAIAAQTYVPDIALRVLRNLATAISGQSAVSAPVLDLTDFLTTAVQIATGTSGAVEVLRFLATAIAAQAAISDIDLSQHAYWDLVTIIAMQAQIPDIDLVLTFRESLLAKAKRHYAPVSAADLEAASLQWIAGEEYKEQHLPGDQYNDHEF